MNIRCPNCQTVFRVDPSRIPSSGVRARCARCAATFHVTRDGTASAPRAPAAQATLRPPETGRSESSPRDQPPTPQPTPSYPPPSTGQASPPAPGTGQTSPAADHGEAPPATASRPPAAQPQPPAAQPHSPAAESHPPAASSRAPVGPARPSTPSPGPAQQRFPGAPPAAAGASHSGPAGASSQASSASAGGPAGASPSTTAPRPGLFGSRDPKSRAQRIARALVSDIVAYHPKRRDACLAAGTLRTEFRDEIMKSWEEYTEQVGEEMAKSTPYFRNALNDILAKGQPIF